MPDYNKGKIYVIRSHKTDLIYIGSTIQPLSVRIGKHRNAYNNYLKSGNQYFTSTEIFTLDPNPYIELIINFSCSCKEELRKEEGKYIRKMKCVNKNVAGRTEKEWREDNKERLKQYRYENKDKKKKYDKKYEKENIEYRKKWKVENIEKIKEYHKKYRNEIIKCPSCNLELKRNNLNYHKKKCDKSDLKIEFE